jgi:methionyl-tRNA synthetase
LTSRLSVSQDGDFSEERFRNIVNANLANDIGNLLNRTLNLLKKNCGGEIPADSATVPLDHPLRRVTEEQVHPLGPAAGQQLGDFRV